MYFVHYRRTNGEIVSHGQCADGFLTGQETDEFGALEVPTDASYELTHYVASGVLTQLPEHAFSVSDYQIAGDGVEQASFTGLVNPTEVTVIPPFGKGLANSYLATSTDGSFDLSATVEGVYSIFIQAPLVLDETVEVQVGSAAYLVPRLNVKSTFVAPFGNSKQLVVPDLNLAATFNAPVTNAKAQLAIPTLNLAATFNNVSPVDNVEVATLAFTATLNAPLCVDVVHVDSLDLTATFNEVTA